MQPEPVRLLSFPLGPLRSIDPQQRHLTWLKERATLESISQFVYTTGE